MASADLELSCARTSRSRLRGCSRSAPEPAASPVRSARAATRWWRSTRSPRATTSVRCARGSRRAAGSFAAAVTVVSLHHVEPLEESCRRLGELVEADDPPLRRVRRRHIRPRRRRLVARAAQRARRAASEDRRGARRGASRALASARAVPRGARAVLRAGTALRGAWLHRWNLGDSLRAVEEEAIARGRLRAAGARLVGRRRR